MLEKLEDGSIKFYGTDYDLLEIITRPMNIRYISLLIAQRAYLIHSNILTSSYSIVLHKQEEVIAYGVLNSEIRNLLNFVSCTSY